MNTLLEWINWIHSTLLMILIHILNTTHYSVGPGVLTLMLCSCHARSERTASQPAVYIFGMFTMIRHICDHQQICCHLSWHRSHQANVWGNRHIYTVADMTWHHREQCALSSGFCGHTLHWFHLGFSGWGGDVLRLLGVWFSHNDSHLPTHTEQTTVNMT